MFHVPNDCRLREHETLASDDSYGNNGVFIIHHLGLTIGCIAADGLGWEHVSVRVEDSKHCPSWTIMNHIKDLFWDEEDCVVQYHPPKSVYVNINKYCLHLWRPIGKEIPIPSTELL